MKKTSQIRHDQDSGDTNIQLGVNHASMLLITHLNQQPAYTPQVRTWEGKQYYIVPVVMMVEGVHNGSRGRVLHTAEELGKIVEAWNGIPVTIGHPATDEGAFISANSPNVLSDWAVGKVFHAHMDGDKLKAEVWLDIVKLESVSPDSLVAVQSGQMMEVSVGVFSEDEAVEGEWNGEQYVAVAHNHRPDHLALLPGQVGACSNGDGCGLRVNEQMKGYGDMEVIVNNELLKNLAGKGWATIPMTSQEGMSATLNKLQRVLDNMDAQGVSHYLEEAYDGYIVFNKRNETGSELYKQSYQQNPDGTVELVGDPIKVTKKVEYIAVQQSSSNTKTVITMCEPCKEKVTALISAESTHFNENDREWLEALTEDKLDKMIPKMIRVQNNVKTPTIDEAWGVIKTGAKPEDYISNIPDEVKIQINAEFKAKEERQTLIQNILTNSDWTEDDLDGMSLSVLKKLETTSKAVGTNYAGNTGGAQDQTGKKSEVTPMPLPGVEFK